MSGKVWLVGAGPSDEELLTIKGKKVLQQAEVVLYDRLVGYGILSLIPDSAECIDVGKTAGNHTMPQEEINRLLLQKAQDGKRVVRLKGGDPFVFGRGGEELELLAEHEIPFEVVPGVTSAVAVAAYSGIPVTHRDYTSSIHIVTGHKKKGECDSLDFEALVRTEGTLVFLMGVRALPELCRGLMDAGMEPDMPAAILQKGTTARQKKIVATVSSLEAEVRRQGIETPAIIVVGKVCTLAEEFAWYEKKPLFGRRILVTRPRRRGSKLADLLRREGAEVLEIPAIESERMLPEEECMQMRLGGERYDVVAFTSPTGVEIFFEWLRESHTDVRSLAGSRIAAIGSATKRELEQRGLMVDWMPQEYDGRALGSVIRQQCSGGEKILIPRAKNGGMELIQELREIPHVQISDVPIYETHRAKGNGALSVEQLIENGELDLVVFTSASTVDGFMAQAGGADVTDLVAVCIGERTAEAARMQGMQVLVSEHAKIEDMVKLAIDRL